MVKYHIGKNGPSECRAFKRECPVGGEHFESLKEAERAYGEVNETFNSLSKSAPSTVHLSSNFLDVDVVDGDLSNANARMALTTGYCGDLAHEVIKLNGGRPVFLTFDGRATAESFRKDFEANPNIIFNSPHVLASTSEEGVYIDAYGRRTLEDLEEGFEEAVPILGDEEMLDKWMSNSNSADLSNFAKSAVALYEAGEGYDYDDALDEFEFDDEDEDYYDEDE